jgi:hypothetical protein
MTAVLFRIRGFRVDEDLATSVSVDIGQHEVPREAFRAYAALNPIPGASPYAQALVEEGSALCTPSQLPENDPGVFVTSNGQVHFSDWYWDYATLGDFERAHEAGYLQTDPHDWTVEIHEGIGGDGPSAQFLIAFLVEMGVDLIKDALISGTIAGSALTHQWVRDFRAREAAAGWATERGLYAPEKLRYWLDKKDKWTWSEVSQRLRISADTAQSLLEALGYEPDASNTWRMGWSETARVRRQKWIENETRHWS